MKNKSKNETELEKLIGLYGSLEAYNEEQRRCGLAAIEEATRLNPYNFIKGVKMRNPNIEMEINLQRMVEFQQEAGRRKIIAQLKKERETSKNSFWTNLIKTFRKGPGEQTTKQEAKTNFGGAKPSYISRED